MQASCRHHAGIMQALRSHYAGIMHILQIMQPLITPTQARVTRRLDGVARVRLQHCTRRCLLYLHAGAMSYPPMNAPVSWPPVFQQPHEQRATKLIPLPCCVALSSFPPLSQALLPPVLSPVAAMLPFPSPNTRSPLCADPPRFAHPSSICVNQRSSSCQPAGSPMCEWAIGIRLFGV